MAKFKKAGASMPNKDKVDAYSGGVTGGQVKKGGDVGFKETVKPSRGHMAKGTREWTDRDKARDNAYKGLKNHTHREQ